MDYGIMMLKKIFVSVPARLQIPENIKEQLIVELANNNNLVEIYGNI
jgi:hypothetical protein